MRIITDGSRRNINMFKITHRGTGGRIMIENKMISMADDGPYGEAPNICYITINDMLEIEYLIEILKKVRDEFYKPARRIY